MPLARRAAALALALVLSLAALPVAAEKPLAAPDPAGLQLASVYAAVAEVGGERLYAKHADIPVPIASITKLMTAMVVLDSGAPLDAWLPIVAREHEPANNGYSRMRIGSELQRGALIRIALMSSENLATHVLASHYPGGRTAFVAAMNAKAEALGMHDSHFVGPSGLSKANQSTAADLLKLLTASLDYPQIRDYTQTESYRARFRNPRYSLPYGNTDVLVFRDDWDVVVSKTGYLDAAGRCLAVVVDVNGHRLAMVLLDSFGSLSPVGDVGRVAQWLATGDGGEVAAAALAYERRATAALAKGLAAKREAIPPREDLAAGRPVVAR